MPLDYELDSQLKELTEISAEYLDWFLQLTKHIVFADDVENAKRLSPPKSFLSWLNQMSKEEGIEKTLLDRLTVRCQRLIEYADKMKAEVKQNNKPVDKTSYDELSDHFEKFMDTLRRVEKELILDENGIDEITGLRRKSVLQKDLDREMQRLSRQGKPFSLALVKIDHFDEIAAAEGAHIGAYLKHISELIKQSLRSFDDAYRIDDAEFILSLKQADVTGGIRALERLKELLEMNTYTFKSKKLTSNMASLSCCVAEPLPDDDVNELMENMHKDLKEADKDDDTVLEYYELSPLQRYIKAT